MIPIDTVAVGKVCTFSAVSILNKKLLLVTRFWSTFHNFIVVGLLFTLLGIAIGIKVSKDFYTTKIDEVISTGAMLHKAKVYTISPKL